MRSITFIGYDPRPIEVMSFAVARNSIRRRLTRPIPIRGLVLSYLQASGLYTRPTEWRDGILWDVISGAPMSTEFAISRFLVPHLAQDGWALFVDADVMARRSLCELFDQADRSKAVMVVKHPPYKTGPTKMDGQVQTSYARKNWSSVCLWNCDHPKVRALTPHVVNSMRGLDLHQFKFLDDDEIGELHPSWNWLPGITRGSYEPALVHFSEGVPAMKGYEDAAYSEEWFRELKQWAER